MPRPASASRALARLPFSISLTVKTGGCSRTSACGHAIPRASPAWPSRRRCLVVVVTDGILPLLGVKPALGRIFASERRSLRQPADGRAHGGLLADAAGCGSGRDRPADRAGRAADGNHRRPARYVPLHGSEAVADPAAAARSNKIFLGNFSYTGLARLKPGATLEQATADAARLLPLSLTRFPPSPATTRRCSKTPASRPSFRLLKTHIIGDVGLCCGS